MNKRFLQITTILTILTLSIISNAAQISKGKKRVSLETPFLSLGVGEQDVGGNEENATYIDAFLGHKAIFGFGGAIANKWLIGGRITLALHHEDYGSELMEFRTMALPYVEYNFLSGKVIPFITLTMGLEMWFQGEDEDAWGANFYLAAGGGFHFFPWRFLSLDTTLLLGFSTGGGEDNNIEYNITMFRTDILIGLSIWF